MLPGLALRLARTVDRRALGKLLINLAWGASRSLRHHSRRLRGGVVIPPFLEISVTSACNLRCQGCWADVDVSPASMPAEVLHSILREAREVGNRFFGLLGGEPLLHPHLLDVIEAHPDLYFQLFTNGHPLTADVARRLRRAANVTPIISIEGTPLTSDERRGHSDVFARSLRAIERCVDQRLLTGVATSLCRSNIDDLLDERWLRRLIDLGVHYVWYYLYRPCGPRSSPELALDPAQTRAAREFIVEMRRRLPILIVDTYYDHLGRPLCPMAIGLSHHINPRGMIEPCPIIQFAHDRLGDGCPLPDAFARSRFLSDCRELAARTTRGCILLEHPDLLERLVRERGVPDATLRQTALDELAALRPHPSQIHPGPPIPERHWLYRLAKRAWFSDRGVYNALDRREIDAPRHET